MLIKMKTHAAGPAFNAAPNEERVVEDDFGQALIDGGFAELVCEVWTPAADAEADAASPPAAKRERATARPAAKR